LKGKPLQRQFDEFAKGYAQAAVLTELVSDLDEEQLDALLKTHVRKPTGGWLVRLVHEFPEPDTARSRAPMHRRQVDGHDPSISNSYRLTTSCRSAEPPPRPNRTPG
jgi:hypothetical protein